MEYIKEIKLDNLWGSSRNIHWENLHPHVNILVGINGSGKTSLLNVLWGSINEDFRPLKKYKVNGITIETVNAEEETTTPLRILKKSNPYIAIGDTNFGTEFISTFDVIPSNKSKLDTPLTTELLDVIYTTGKGRNSFFDYRLKTSNFPERAAEINANIQWLYKLINKQFEATNKKIMIDVDSNKLVFKQNNDIIHLEELSSGEKQFLLIIFKVFLMEKKPFVLIMDEPEISLDIDWQFDLINIIHELNPNCQIIISTHSPSIFGDGWGDKVVYMEDITKI
ncbi:ABC-type lipoprotein export system ATPase subunit [Dysgonomonadaceae bacterium PH5-43]|nr:ABC-type lipoprotein export system ATPase subunit [Dysgonomonadaceae bacterium PH5-43]